ncbi:MAG: beta-lactamase family protein [Saprospiraceae bacterium]|nr:beta-lactamase family protein [Saprospiraceae bacterium]
MRIAVILFILSNLLAPVLGQISEVQIEQIDAIFKEVNRTDMPGCALAIVQEGTTVYEKGYGMADLERHVAITPQTVFYAGSVSKQFVASCVLLLAEDGKINLADPIGKYFPDFPGYGSAITIQHLIHHTSGIKDYFDIFEDRGHNYLNQIAQEEVYRLIIEENALQFPPGQKYSYSNSGYLMLAMIIEQITGSSFSTFVQEQIFDPLDMTCSMFLDDARKLVPNRAWGYEQNYNDQIENMIMRFDLVGSGGLYTTVGDLAKWNNHFDQPTLGSAQFLDKLLTTGHLNDGTDTNYAFAIRRDRFLGRQVVGHSGSLGGYRSQFTRFPDDKLTIIILSNLANFKPGERAHEVAKILLKPLTNR